ncbi:MAG: hypothetical protein ACLR9W_15040 [Enterobacter hormaechei]
MGGVVRGNRQSMMRHREIKLLPAFPVTAYPKVASCYARCRTLPARSVGTSPEQAADAAIFPEN